MENKKVLSLLISNAEIKNAETDRNYYINSGYKEDILQTFYELELAYCNLKTPIYLTVIEQDSKHVIKSKLVSYPANKKMTKKEKTLTGYADLIKLFNNYCKGEIDYVTFRTFKFIPQNCDGKVYRIENVLDIYEHMTNQSWYGEDVVIDDNYKLLDDFCLYLVNNYSEFMTKDLTKVRKRNLPLSDWAVVESAGLLKTRLSNWIYY